MCMLRRVLCLCVIALLLLSTNAFAGGVGNVLSPVKTTTDRPGGGVGFEYNGVSSRLMNMYNTKSGTEDMKVDHLNQYYGKITLGFSENYNVYGKIGGCGYDLKFKEKVGDRKVVMNLRPGVYAGIGFNTSYPLVEVYDLPINFGYGMQGNVFFNSVDKITRGSVEATNVKGSFYGLDGQNSLYISCKYDIDKIKTSIVPYIGAYYSWIAVGSIDNVEFDTPATGGPIVSGAYPAALDVLSFGLLLGADIDIMKHVVLNVAGRFIGETAITTGATVKF